MQYHAPSSPISVFCAAAPSDTALLTQWETHLLPLGQIKHIVVWSEKQLLAGASRLQQINNHLDQAQVIFLLLSADFFASDECVALMNRALANKSRVIPLLVRYSGWQHSPLASFACLPPNGLPVMNWNHPEEAFQACYQELLRILGLSHSASTPIMGTSAVQNQNHMPHRASNSPRHLVIIWTVLVTTFIILIGGSILAWTNRQPPAPAITPIPTPTQASFPVLHNSYAGTLTRLNLNVSLDFRIASLIEDTHTGTFTATAVINGCNALIDGNLTVQGVVNFKTTQSSIDHCNGIQGEFAGNIEPDGSMGGTWTAPNTSTADNQGAWTVQPEN